MGLSSIAASSDATSWPACGRSAAARFTSTRASRTRGGRLDRLIRIAKLAGANAILFMRFDSSELSGTMSEIVAYGTVVVVKVDSGATASAGID